MIHCSSSAFKTSSSSCLRGPYGQRPMGYWLLLPIVAKWEAAHQVSVITWGGLEQFLFKFETSPSGMQISNKLQEILDFETRYGAEILLWGKENKLLLLKENACSKIVCLFVLSHLPLSSNAFMISDCVCTLAMHGAWLTAITLF